MINQKKVRPPLKWAGGKYRLLDAIREKLPDGNRLIEPFVGSGVVFINANYKRFLINDINKDLISFYKILKREEKRFVQYTKNLFNEKNNSEEFFYSCRDEFNSTTDEFRKAALFLYINKHGYNGLIRYNASGLLNVPFGRYKKPYHPEKELFFLAEKLKKATIQNKDFEKVMRSAAPGDVIYCDPPYVPLSSTANFTAYSAGGFGEKEQLRLAHLACELTKNDVHVVISNHFTPLTENIYREAEQETFKVRRLISCNGADRKNITEVLAVFSPKMRKKK